MGCGCGGGAKAGRALVTSGDVAAAGMVGAPHGNRSVTPLADEPLLVVRLDGADAGPIPPEARFRVTVDSTVAYFDGHGGAFAWQQANGGKLRTVKHPTS